MTNKRIVPQADFEIHLGKFVELARDEFKSIEGYFVVKGIRKGQYLVRSGDAVNHTWWVKRGLVISSLTDDQGKEHIIQFANEGCWITDQNAFYNREKATFNIQVLEDSELLSLSFENREKLCHDFKRMETFFRRKANDSFTKQQKRMLTYLTSDSEQRYELFLKEYPALMQRLSKKILAAYLGVSRETLSRFYKKANFKM
jgi:CRP-like cAMP-binding protein